MQKAAKKKKKIGQKAPLSTYASESVQYGRLCIMRES
jgi:hypothetical protein